MSRTRILWHSNAPFTPTGYGQQSALVTPYLAQHYDLAISSFYGLEGSPIRWEGIPILPGVGGDFGSNTIAQHAKHFFGGDPRGGLVVTLMDVWVLDPDRQRGLNLACWVPVDHEPAPPKVTDFLFKSDAVPIAMSRFGEYQLGRLDPLYVPHAVDTDLYKPMGKSEVRGRSFPEDAFVVGMVAANKGRPSRKGFSQALQAFARFAAEREDVYLYLHTVLDHNMGGGENIASLLRHLGVPQERIRIADQYTMLHNPYSSADMAKIFNALDVLMNPAWGEGFGIPVLEAQACGVPAVVTDFSAMPEVCGAGWKVPAAEKHWTALESWQAIPSTDEIYAALVECYELSPKAYRKLSAQAREHSLQYDVRRVVDEHFLPALRVVEQRFAARKPVTIPARKAVAA